MPLDGLITQRSRYSAPETLQRLERAVVERGYTVFARLDHAAAAAALAVTMPASTVVVFGNPRTSTDLVIAYPSLAIDLPLRALVWGDAKGSTWVRTNSVQYLLKTAFLRHRVPLTAALRQQVERTATRIAAIVGAATDMAG